MGGEVGYPWEGLRPFCSLQVLKGLNDSAHIFFTMVTDKEYTDRERETETAETEIDRGRETERKRDL